MGLAYELDNLAASGAIYGWRYATAAEKRCLARYGRRESDSEIRLHLGGCFQFLSADGAREFVANTKWLAD